MRHQFRGILLPTSPYISSNPAYHSKCYDIAPIKHNNFSHISFHVIIIWIYAVYYFLEMSDSLSDVIVRNDNKPFKGYHFHFFPMFFAAIPPDVGIKRQLMGGKRGEWHFWRMNVWLTEAKLLLIRTHIYILMGNQPGTDPHENHVKNEF